MITLELAELLSEIVNDRLIDLHTALPGKVVAWNEQKRLADIEIQVKRVLETEDNSFKLEEMPVLPDVPVAFMRTNEFYVSMPIEPGVTGLVHFCESNIDQWRSLNKVASPTEIGRHTLTSGVFVPGLVSNEAVMSGVPTDAVVVGRINGATVSVTADDTVEGQNSAGAFTLNPTGIFDVNGNFTVDP